MSNADISTEIRTLRQHIQATAEQLAQRVDIRKDDTSNDLGALIYLGNHHDAVPRGLIIDPIMLGDEIRTWMLMKIHVANPMLATRIPSQDWLMETLQCSRPIVSRHIQVLRALRWLTLCADVRGHDGKYRGTVYAQHDQPLSLAETLYLDAQYIDFLEQPTKGDVLKRLQAIKRSVLAHTDHLVMEQGQSLDTPPTHLEQIDARLKSHISADPMDTHLSCPAFHVEPDSVINIYAAQPDATPDHVKNIDTVEMGKTDRVKNIDTAEGSIETDKQNKMHHVKNIDTVKTGKMVEKQPSHPVKNFYMDDNRSYCSSSLLNTKKTTTTPPTPPLNSDLRYPADLRKSTRLVTYADKKLGRLPENQRQFALDYLTDRIQAGESGAATPVKNTIGLLEWVVQHIVNGTLPDSAYGIRPDPAGKKGHQTRPNGEDSTEAQKRFAEHVHKLGFQIDPKKGIPVRKKTGNAG